MQSRLPSADQAGPWLVYPCGKRNKNHILFSLSQSHKIYRKRIHEFSGDTTILNTCSDWFLLRRGKANYSIWNPNKSESIELPPLSLKTPIKACQSIISQPDIDGNCKVLLFQSRSILFVRPHKQWREIPYKSIKCIGGIQVRDGHLYWPVCCNGKLYACLFLQGKLVSVDVDEADKLSIQLLCEMPHIPRFCIRVVGRLIESCGQLFYISIGLGGKMLKQAIEVHAFKLDFSRMVWNRVQNLMGQAFFIDLFHHFSSPAIGVQQDNIYFTLPKDKALYSFNVRDGCLSVTLTCPWLPTPWSDPIFFIADSRINSSHDTKTVVNREDKKKEKEDILHAKEIEGVTVGDLPLDVINLIANCFISSDDIFDYMNFRTVCRDFWLAAPKLKLRKLQISPLFPWLQFPTSDWCSQNFVDPRHGSSFLMSMNIPKSLAGSRLRFSKDGWMLMSDGKNSLSFYNPFKDQVIDIPDVPQGIGVFGASFSVCFSSVPTSPDCVVMGFGCCPLRVTLFTMRDKEWQLIVLDEDEDDYEFLLNFSSPVFHKGLFYLLGETGDLLTVNFPEEDWYILDKTKTPCKSFHRSYLLEWDGKLTSVFVDEKGVQVYVLNDTEMKWESVQSLRNHTFFVSQTSCLVKEATNTGMENRIYFPRFHGENILFYSLDTGRIHFDDSQDFVENFYNTKEQVFGGWIDPNIISCLGRLFGCNFIYLFQLVHRVKFFILILLICPFFFPV